MSRLMLIGLALISGLGVSCAYKKVSYQKGTGFSNEGQFGKGVSLEMEWLKNKKDSIDVKFKIGNDYDHPVIISGDSVLLTLGDKKVAPRESATLELKAHQSRVIGYVFPFAKEAREGEATLSFGTITEGPYEKADKKELPPLSIKLNVPRR